MPGARSSQSPTRPWVRIGIVTFNSGDYTQSCLDALAAQTDPDFEAVIWDNGSTDGAAQRLRLPDSRFRLVEADENTGFAGGTNRALAGATTPYVMSMNPDTALEPDCLAALRAQADAAPDAAMLSPVLLRPDGRLDGMGDCLSIHGIAWRAGVGDVPEALAEPCEVFSPTGAGALFRRDLFEREGGFDETFFCYLEDVDLALRLRARGHHCLLVPNARGTHVGGHSTDALPGFAVRSSSRNALRMIVHSAPLGLLPLMLGSHIAAHLWFQFRNRGTDLAQARGEGFRAGLRALPRSVADRLRRRPYPPGASFRVGRRLAWTIRAVNRRAPLRWPWTAPPPD